jgi:capsular polysaccharide biosynthesis protein
VLFRSILLAYGIKNNQIIKKPTFETWKIKKLIFPSINWFEISKKESIYLSNKIVRKNFNKNNNFKKIYISRRDARDNRNLINEKEIEKYLANKGFKIIQASQLNIHQKINILENAEIIISTFGSALSNFFFCKNIKAKVILIGTKRFFIRDFLQFSFLKNIQLYFLNANEIPSYSKQWEYQVSSFFLEEKNLENLLKKII